MNQVKGGTRGCGQEGGKCGGSRAWRDEWFASGGGSFGHVMYRLGHMVEGGTRVTRGDIGKEAEGCGLLPSTCLEVGNGGLGEAMGAAGQRLDGGQCYHVEAVGD
jgi:hypothetical protein